MSSIFIFLSHQKREISKYIHNSINYPSSFGNNSYWRHENRFRNSYPINLSSHTITQVSYCKITRNVCNVLVEKSKCEWIRLNIFSWHKRVSDDTTVGNCIGIKKKNYFPRRQNWKLNFLPSRFLSQNATANVVFAFKFRSCKRARERMKNSSVECIITSLC